MSREKRVTEVCQAPRGHQDPKEIMVLLAPQVLLVPWDLQDYQVLLVLKELRGHRVKLVPRERLVFLDNLGLLVLLGMSSTHCPCSRAPSGAAGTSMPAR